MAVNRPTSPPQAVFDATEVSSPAAVPSFADLGLPAVLCARHQSSSTGKLCFAGSHDQ